MNTKRLSVVAAMALAASSLVATTTASAAPPVEPGDVVQRSDNLPNPLAEEQAERRQTALERVLSDKGESGPVAQVAKGQFVELEREGEESIWTVLGEFADTPHNSIPEPDREVDNSTIWQPDFSEEYYENLLFEENVADPSMRDFYLELSSGRYTVNGDVTDWVGVSGDKVDYGTEINDAGQPCPNCTSRVWPFIEETVDNTWDDLVAELGEDGAREYLADFDVWDRYDYDGDGDFDESDGYIDHFQAVHAGPGAETGDPEAIWSHRWYIQSTGIGEGGPSSGAPNGGYEVGDSGIWIGDYTVEPENGGVGVFAHEYAHDLGLPDLYDTGGGENGTGFWTLMSSGSYGNDGTVDIGTKPMHMGAWEKFQLGWLDYEVAYAGEKSQHKLGPASATTKQAQAVITILPQKEVFEEIGTPFEGDTFLYSGQGNNLDNVAYVEAELTGSSEMTAMVDYDIEVDWDYAYAVVSTDQGATWQSVPTNLSTNTDPNGQNFGDGITGDSNGWTELTADLSGHTGTAWVGFRYWTDVAAIEPGFSADAVAIDGTDVAEEDFTLDGFTVTTGSSSAFYNQYYIAENRVYRGYDDALRTGPYNFGFLDQYGDLVERFPYQDGLLISLWDTSQNNNNTSQHPGEGLILPIDAHPETMVRADGAPWRPRIQTYDATFGVEDTDALTLHHNSQPSNHPSLPAESVFDDTKQYYNDEIPRHGVINPNTGTQIRVKNTSAQGNFMQVEVRPSE
ncbi:M6 family metalloprotease domain-containing protein [Salsipaludibacter albus]|uniref:M6 family metalloprotease domain-containing protein n=1 Tax=Salsipaludibacter albus TaxID=2849650 RepID=UPI001EE44EA6|nr:M6 family metalloprotease domain-containing protein [Salsipaludibacter albus]MBY5161174.1 immune inhibitor A [Salsipaludibacter albus]